MKTLEKLFGILFEPKGRPVPVPVPVKSGR